MIKQQESKLKQQEKLAAKVVTLEEENARLSEPEFNTETQAVGLDTDIAISPGVQMQKGVSSKSLIHENNI